MANPKPVTDRSTVIDALRGLAVLGMMAAHAIFFFHNSTNPILMWIQGAANTVVFTLFVFVAGAAASGKLDRYAHLDFRHRLIRILRYTGALYIGYAVVALFGVFTTIPHFPPNQLPAQILGVLTLVRPINFTEYVPLFILLPITITVAGPLYRFARNTLTSTVLFGALAYILGVLLYPLQLPSLLNPIKELIAGGREILRFPMLFYLPVYLLGLWWEHHMEPPGKPRTIQKTHIYLMLASVFITIAGVVLSGRFDIPILAPNNRWPPSLGFLSAGVSLAALLLFVASAMPKPAWIMKSYRFLLYMGRDAYDLWMTHLLLLFAYRWLVGTQYGSIATVFFLFLLFFIATIYFSSLTIINPISVYHFGRVVVAPYEGARFRKRYGVIAAVVGVLLVLSFYKFPIVSPYGATMATNAVSVYDRLRPDVTLTLTSQRLWHLKSGPVQQPIRLSLQAKDKGTGAILRMNPTNVTITTDGKGKEIKPTRESETSLEYEIPPGDLPTGTRVMAASVSDGFVILSSNKVSAIVTEPLLVSWTFDWEGWDAPDWAMRTITQLHVPFTHFVNPRTFLEGVIPAQRQEVIRTFLRTRAEKGDEIALHIHMQYDLVTAAGVAPRTTPHWGYLSDDGYDVPTTAYTPEEFRRIVQFSRQLLVNLGFPEPKGYRAGGWFLSGEQLSDLAGLGFQYDSSGRNRPFTGSFANTPWDLPIGAQPYYPYPDNQNVASPTVTGILEIPTNGTTFDENPNDLLARLGAIYSGTFLTTPKALVFVSHPQFAALEFNKIPQVISALTKISAAQDAGPVVFTTTSDIHALWTSLTR